MIFLSLLLLTILLFSPASIHANTEKIIFRAPNPITIPDFSPNLEDLKIDFVSPTRNIIRAQIVRAFPNQPEPKGLQSWYLLDSLEPSQRYELRVCWAATVSSFRRFPM